MQDLLIQNTLLITLDQEQTEYFNGDILISEGLIKEIEKEPFSIAPRANCRVIEGHNLLIMPGLVNTHGHAAMTLFRSYADDLPLKEWLEEKIWPIEEYLESDDIYWGTMLAAAEMIRGGTTTFTDMYFHMDRVAEATTECGLRAVLSRGMIGFGDSAEKGLRETRDLIEKWHGAAGGRINIFLGPHAPYTCPPDYLKKVIKLAEDLERPLQIHLSETKREVEESFRQYGKSPIQLVAETGLFQLPVIAAHCVHLSDQDIELLAEYKVGVAHNPGSNLKLGSGIAPVVKMLEKKIKVGIGTDGAASNNNLDMFEEMRLTALLNKGVEMNPTLINARTALMMAAPMGAEALGLAKVGILKEGYKADCIGIRIDKPHLVPLHNPLAHVVYSAAAADVELVVVDGRLLMEKGELKTIDEERVLYETAKHAERLVNSAQEKQV